MIGRLGSTKAVPTLFKQDPHFQDAPEGTAWEAEFEAAMGIHAQHRLARSGSPAHGVARTNRGKRSDEIGRLGALGAAQRHRLLSADHPYAVLAREGTAERG